MNILEILVVVDMQDYFLGSLSMDYGPDGGKDPRRDALVENVLKHIAQAKKAGNPIICLEYADLEHDPDYDRSSVRATWTCQEIRDALKHYRKAYFPLKDDNCGAGEVEDVICGMMPRRGLARNGSRLHNWCDVGADAFDFKVCGVNLDACVAETAEGLQYIYGVNEIKILPDASRNTWDNEMLPGSPENETWLWEPANYSKCA